jgi:PKD repeat protein
MKRKYLFVMILIVLAVFFATAGNAKSMLLRIVADGEGMQNETVVYFEQGATVAHNPVYDAPSLGTSPGYLNIVSWLNNINYQVKGLPPLTQGYSIPLKVTTGATGTYQVYCMEMNNLPEGACVFLADAYTGVSWNLRNGAYSCAVSDTEQVSRFTLTIITSALSGVSASAQAPACSHSADGIIIASVQGAGPWNYYWKDGNNNLVKTTLNAGAADTLAALDAGDYRVDVNTNGTCDNHTEYFTLNAMQAPVADFVSDTLVAEQADIVFTNTSARASTYWWDFGDGMGSADENPQYAYGAPGTYTVMLTAIGSTCTDTSITAKVINVTGSTGAIMAQPKENILISRDQNGYYVQFDLRAEAGATIRLYDYQGKSLAIINKSNITNNRVYLDVTGLRGSIMFVNVQVGAEVASRKIAVE